MTKLRAKPAKPIARPVGRPKLDPAIKTRKCPLWLTPPRADKLKRLGGSKWVSKKLDEN